VVYYCFTSITVFPKRNQGRPESDTKWQRDTRYPRSLKPLGQPTLDGPSWLKEQPSTHSQGSLRWAPQSPCWQGVTVAQMDEDPPLTLPRARLNEVEWGKTFQASSFHFSLDMQANWSNPFASVCQYLTCIFWPLSTGCLRHMSNGKESLGCVASGFAWK